MMQTIRCEIDDGIATLTLDAPGSAVNTMTAQWQADLAQAVAWLEAEKARIRGVLLTSAKTTFFAGAQLTHLLTLKAEDAGPGFHEIEAMKKCFRRLETLGRPVVALLAGAALGGGWELALAAHARFALDDRRIRFGTPEVTLGLIPGATGITKTVRLLGLTAAQPYLLEGKLFDPREALALGLVQGLGESVENLRGQALAWIADHPDAIQPWDHKDHRLPGGTPDHPKIAAGLAVAPAMLYAKTRGLYPAAHAILETMVEGARVDYDTATRIESRKLAKIMVGQNAKNMISAFFFNLNAIKAGQSRPVGFPRWKPTKVGVRDAGPVGAGITQVNAACGIPSAGIDLEGCDLIIEPGASTSTPSTGGLVRARVAPDRSVGLHFFAPVREAKLVEIVRGAQTDDETVARLYDYVLAIGKMPIVVKDSPGFFTSRVFASFVAEGAAMLDEGIAAPLIEHAALAVGMPAGPLASLDKTSRAPAVPAVDRPRADLAELGRRFLYRQAIETARCLAEGVLASVPEANIGSIFGIGFPAWTGGAFQFIASEGLERFEANAAVLAGRHGAGFALSAAVREGIRRHLG